VHTYEIPREEWPMAITAFGEEHRRWRVSLEVLGAEIGAQPEVHDLPLEGISAEPPNKGGSIFIFVERAPDDHLTHIITNPARVSVEENDDRSDAMQIEAGDGTKTIVTFAPPSTAT
jgi:Family of unknown function (DUF5335)